MCLVSFSKTQDYSSREKLVAFNGRPLWAYINITDRCSHKCRWCYGGFNGNLSEAMSFDEYSIVLSKLKTMGILQVSLSGGEPTEHPRFKEFVTETCRHGFLTHLVTHGGTLTQYAGFLAATGVKQVQVNYQGEGLHDAQHGIEGAFSAQQQGLRAALSVGLEVTATTTVGQYNLAKIPAIFSELESIGLDRFRVWESTGRGNPWRKGLEASEIFEYCRTEAAKRGYTYIQSYDPEYSGHTGSRCPPMSNLHMHINTSGKLRFCPAVLKSDDLADFKTDAPEVILAGHRANNERLLALNNGQPWCVARGEKHAHLD